MPSIEIGSGENPDPAIDIHCDIMPGLPHVEVVCPMDAIPFPDAHFDRLRANDVLEHQSWELVPATLREWARILQPDSPAYIQVPDGGKIIAHYVSGYFDTRTLNYYICGGHSDRPAHRGVDEHGFPRWIWNAHHTIFDRTWLTQLLADAGFVVDSMDNDWTGWNLAVMCRRV